MAKPKKLENIEIEEIDQDQAEILCRKITSDLPEYFGISSVNEQYFEGVRACKNIAAKVGDNYVGLLSLSFPYTNNSNIYWMAVLQDYQSKGVGRKLIEYVSQLALKLNATTMTVETLAPEESDENYLKTYDFYQSLGFKPLINLKPEGYEWNMVYMVKQLANELPDILNQLRSGMTKAVNYRPAEKTDLNELNSLIHVSKAYWGYSDEFMNKFMELFQLTEEYLTNSTVRIMLENNKIVGICGFKLYPDKTLELDYFFIHPDYIGRGLGKNLWHYACEIAQQLTDDSFILWSDPEAESFYIKMGCKRIGMKKSPLLPDREAPMMQYFFKIK